MKALLNRFTEPSSWAALAVAAVAATVAMFVPMPALPQTILIVAALVAVAFGFGLPERLRDRF